MPSCYINSAGRKTQTTRMLKLACTGCEWTCRTARRNIHTAMSCPLPGCDGQLTAN